MKEFYKHFVIECQNEYNKLLCWGWALALLALFTGAVVTTIIAIVMLVMAYIGAPTELEMNDGQDSSTAEG